MNGQPSNMKELEISTARKDNDIIVLAIFVKKYSDIAIFRDYSNSEISHPCLDMS
jgi:hypothetical protein